MFGFPPSLSRSGSNRSGGRVSPLGSSRVEQPYQRGSESSSRRREGYGEPDLTRVDSRSYREPPPSAYERSSSRRGSDYAGVDLSAFAGGYDPSTPARRSSASQQRYADFDRLYDSSQQRSSSSRRTTAADYLDALGSGYEPRREEYTPSRREYYPPSSTYREPSSRREYPYSASSNRRNEYPAEPSSRRSGGGGGSVADMLGGPFGSGRGAYPDDENRYPYWGERRSGGERRSERRGFFR